MCLCIRSLAISLLTVHLFVGRSSCSSRLFIPGRHLLPFFFLSVYFEFSRLKPKACPPTRSNANSFCSSNVFPSSVQPYDSQVSSCSRIQSSDDRHFFFRTFAERLGSFLCKAHIHRLHQIASSSIPSAARERHTTFDIVSACSFIIMEKFRRFDCLQ